MLSTKLTKVDDIDNLSAIWILASNDDNHLIFYLGIEDRLDLDQGEVRRLVKEARELFRPDSSFQELKKWKDDKELTIKNNEQETSGSFPEWLIKYPVAEQLRIVNGLTDKDVFRSQFRIRKDSPQSSTEIIQWGLDYIERIRQAKQFEQTTTAKSSEVTWVFRVSVGTLFISLCTLIVTGIAVPYLKSLRPKSTSTATPTQPGTPGSTSQSSTPGSTSQSSTPGSTPQSSTPQSSIPGSTPQSSTPGSTPQATSP